jgi:hypothetical protein
MSETKESQISKVLGALGTLERATELKTFLLIANFAVALHLALTWTHQTTLGKVVFDYSKINFPVGEALIFLTLFTFYMSIGMGILRYFAGLIVMYPMMYISRIHRWLSVRDDNLPRGRPENYVLRGELLDAAQADESGEYLKLYHEHTAEKRRNEKSALQTKSLSFGLLLLLSWDATLPEPLSLSRNVIGFFNSVLPYSGDTLAWVVVGVLLISWLHDFFEDDYWKMWVLCPRLYCQLKIKQEEKEKEMKKTMERFKT